MREIIILRESHHGSHGGFRIYPYSSLTMYTVMQLSSYCHGDGKLPILSRIYNSFDTTLLLKVFPKRKYSKHFDRSSVFLENVIYAF